MNDTPSTFLKFSIRPWGLLTAGGAVLCAATVFGLLGRFFWLMDLFSHFRVQYLMGLGVLAAALLPGRRRKTAVVFLVFACINLGSILPLYFGKPAARPEGRQVVRAMLINVNTRTGDASRVRDVIEKHDPDILVLEEINAQWMRELTWLTNALPHSCIQTREDNFGIGLFSNLPLTAKKVMYIGDADVPTIVTEVVTASAILTVMATHPLPPAGAEYSALRNDQLSQLANHVDASRPLILLGDLNTTPWNYHFRRLLKRSGLLDSSRGRGVQPSWPSHNPLLRIPLDHCLHSPAISIINRRIGEPVSSDHYPVIVDFSITAERPSTLPL